MSDHKERVLFMTPRVVRELELQNYRATCNRISRDWGSTYLPPGGRLYIRRGLRGSICWRTYLEKEKDLTS